MSSPFERGGWVPRSARSKNIALGIKAEWPTDEASNQFLWTWSLQGTLPAANREQAEKRKAWADPKMFSYLRPMLRVIRLDLNAIKQQLLKFLTELIHGWTQPLSKVSLRTDDQDDCPLPGHCTIPY